MSPTKGLVLDANILMRAALGKQVLHLLETYAENIHFYSPDVCFADARHYLKEVLEKRGVNPQTGLSLLDKIGGIVEGVERSYYIEYEKLAQERVECRDPDDWPVTALALLLDLPIWTEDTDFFGSGIPTWTTKNVELYLRN